MTSSERLEVQLMQLDRRRRELYEEIARHKRGWNLFAALFSPLLRKQSFQTIAFDRRALRDLTARMDDLREEQVVVLFLDCLRDELAKLPSTTFLSTSE